MTFLWPLKLEVYNYLKTFTYGYFSVNSAEGNLLARCITLIKMFYIAFIINVLVVAASGICFFPDLCHPTYPLLPLCPPQVYLEMCAPSLSLTHHHTKKYTTKNLRIESSMYIYCTYISKHIPLA